ncbi:MAG: SRPBCC family protein [Chloroflexia bacterium]
MIATNHSMETTATQPATGAVSSQPASDTRELVITRIIDAPRELVFKAWTDPKHMAQWWGPRHFTNPVCEMDVRPGGALLIHMQGPDGVVYPMKGVFHEVVEPERLVISESALEEEEGNALLEILTTVIFAEHEGKTKLTVRAAVTRAAPGSEGALAGMEEGWSQSLDKLAELLGQPTGGATMSKSNLIAEPGKQEIVITRVFDAPRELVFKAFTDPNLIPQWWGPGYLTTTIARMEVRPGGIWRFVQRSPDGNEYGFHGVYHDIVSPERLVYTFEFEGAPGHVLLETVTFEEQDGKTKLTDKSVFQSVEDRDAMLQSGMEGGAHESMDRLAELIARA